MKTTRTGCSVRPPAAADAEGARRQRHRDLHWQLLEDAVSGLRLGYLVADQRVAHGGELLGQALSRVKSLLTVNTPPLLQAVVGGELLRHDGSLETLVAPKRAQYRKQRDAMRLSLERAFGGGPAGVSWNAPTGGFFLTVTLPFAFDAADLRTCARDYGVIVSPMRFFCIGPPRTHQIRLSFSYVEPERIEQGIDRLFEFVRDRIASLAAGSVPTAGPA